MKTIIFIAGWSVPPIVARSKLVWDEKFWKDYNCIFLSSKTPTSDKMVGKELDRLQRLLEQYPNATVAGHSLGGWWASNLALRPDVKINKLALLTPLGDAGPYPIFNVTPRYHPINQPLEKNYGMTRVLVLAAKNDLIVPPEAHADRLARHFKAMYYVLDGGHFWQKNHKFGLSYMKDWMEIY